MDLKTLLVPLTGAPSDSALLETAFGLAHPMGAHVCSVFTRPDPEEVFVYTGMPPSVYSGELEVELSKKIEATGKADAARSRRLFNKTMKSKRVAKGADGHASKKVAGAWEQIVGDPADVIPSLARFSDVTVFSRDSKEYRFSRSGLLVETLMHSGRPALYFPELTGVQKSKDVLIAWNGSAAATRAIAASLPIMALAETITIVTIGPDKDLDAKIDRQTSYLNHYGIPATSEVLPSLGISTGKRLLEHAHKQGADLIVMGGFGHCRYREAMLGGTSRHMLNHSDIPLFIMA